jgi:hypothetical protein
MKPSEPLEGGAAADPGGRAMPGRSRLLGIALFLVLATLGGLWTWLGLPVLAAALLRPALLAPLARPVWTGVQGLALALLFFGLVTPVGMLLRAAGRPPLALKPEPEARTYWRERTVRTDAADAFQYPF